MSSIVNGYTIGPGADLSGADLYGADLNGADLSDADLRGADLRGADLSGAILTRADMIDADLSNANLSGANLYNAIGVEGLSQEQLASTVSKVPTPTIDLNDVDGVITADEVGGWAGLSGTAYPNTTLTLMSTYTKNSNSQSYQILTDTNGIWRLTKDDVGYNPPEGTYSLSITAKDGDGLVSEQAAATLIFDLGTAGTDFDAPTISLNDPNNDVITMA